ncbi:MAG: hypothetical protein GY765_24395 [bacterium]|nr:hypothetical protein [bacterium]
MSIKKRLLLILCISGFLLSLLFYIGFYATMVPDLADQKQIIVSGLHKKLRASLAYEERSMVELCSGWANWHRITKFVDNRLAKGAPGNSDGSHQFEDAFLKDFSFLQHMMNLILILGPENEVLFNTNFQRGVGFISLKNLEMAHALDTIKRNVKQSGRSFKCIVNTAYGSMIVGGHPLKEGRGMLLLGRFLDRFRLEKILMHAGEGITPVSFKQKDLFDFYLKQLKGKEFLCREDKKFITSLYLVRDFTRAPSVILVTRTPYKLFWVAESHTLSYILFSILSVLVLGGMTFLSIEKYINKRIISIKSTARDVEGLKDIGRRIEIDSYNDEISDLIVVINEMLNKIEQEKESRETIEQHLIINEKLVSIGRLSASIAHEINNPVLAISNCTQGLKRSCKQCDGEEANLHQQALEVIESEIRRVQTIISDLLDYHRMEREEFCSINLGDILLQSLEILKWSKQLSSIKIITPKKQDFVIPGAPGKMKQVFINIISNAVEAAQGENGELRIEMMPSEDRRHCFIHFIDNGPGILEDIRPHIFEPFVSSKQGKGVGLGLYVSYKIVKHHNGTIFFDDLYTEGTHFIIQLPLQDAHASSSKTDETAVISNRTYKEHNKS